jgi:hypothetical protein
MRVGFAHASEASLSDLLPHYPIVYPAGKAGPFVEVLPGHIGIARTLCTMRYGERALTMMLQVADATRLPTTASLGACAETTATHEWHAM